MSVLNMTRIVVNAALTQRRRNKRVCTLLTSSCEPDTGEPTAITWALDHSPNPEQSCSREEQSKILQRALRRLSPTRRFALTCTRKGSR